MSSENNTKGVRLRPMDEAPRDGSTIVVCERVRDGDLVLRVCEWVKPYSINSQCGAWRYHSDGDCIDHVREQCALGWMRMPRPA